MRLALPLLLLLLAPVPAAVAQPASIFTCTDAQGRRLTSDRLIAACLDREQLELSPSGTLRRVIHPAPSAQDRARAQDRQRAEALAQAQLAKEKRLEEALLMRYPNAEAHQRTRAAALQPVRAALEAGRQRAEELQRERSAIVSEMELFQRDPSRVPALLKQREASNQVMLASQKTFLEHQSREHERIQRRFDEELTLLQRLWQERDQAAR